MTQHALQVIAKYGLNNQPLCKGCADPISEDMDRQKKILIIPDSEFAVARVKQPVKEGGHSVPEDVIRRRFKTGWSNFERLFKDLVDEWALYDNAGEQPILINEGSLSA